jgi:RyR domain
VLLSGVTEMLAHAIYEDYVRKQRAEGQTPATNPAMVDWGELPDTLKDSNRDQAADIGAKLAAVGCGIVTLTDWSAPPLQFTIDEVELLARMEHDRWCRERTAGGWTYGPERDAAQRVSPYLVPWADLSEEIREYDRNTVRALPQFLASAGFSVVRARADAAGG